MPSPTLVPEIQTCPRRMREMGPWPREEGLDRWCRGYERWGRRETDYFPEHFPKPRSCSFCGGVHPDDAIALIRRGWEVEVTGKLYKRYIHPPGYGQQVQRVLRQIRESVKVNPKPVPSMSVHTPVPPMKLYIVHLDRPQVEAFNAAIDSSAL